MEDIEYLPYQVAQEIRPENTDEAAMQAAAFSGVTETSSYVLDWFPESLEVDDD